MRGVQVRGLARVDDGAAAERDVAIGVRLVREARPVPERRVGGLDVHVGIGDHVQPGRESESRVVAKMGSPATAASENSATRRSPRARARSPDLREAAAPERDPRRVDGEGTVAALGRDWEIRSTPSRPPEPVATAIYRTTEKFRT